MQLRALLRLDSLILIIAVRLGEETSIPEIAGELDRAQMTTDQSSIHRAVGRLCQEGLLTCTGHEMRHGLFLVRVYLPSMRGKVEASARLERLAAVLGLATPAFAEV